MEESVFEVKGCWRAYSLHFPMIHWLPMATESSYKVSTISPSIGTANMVAAAYMQHVVPIKAGVQAIYAISVRPTNRKVVP
jgi:hypothetical protein